MVDTSLGNFFGAHSSSTRADRRKAAKAARRANKPYARPSTSPANDAAAAKMFKALRKVPYTTLDKTLRSQAAFDAVQVGFRAVKDDGSPSIWLKNRYAAHAGQTYTHGLNFFSTKPDDPLFASSRFVNGNLALPEARNDVPGLLAFAGLVKNADSIRWGLCCIDMYNGWTRTNQVKFVLDMDVNKDIPDALTDEHLIRFALKVHRTMRANVHVTRRSDGTGGAHLYVDAVVTRADFRAYTKKIAERLNVWLKLDSGAKDIFIDASIMNANGTVTVHGLFARKRHPDHTFHVPFGTVIGDRFVHAKDAGMTVGEWLHACRVKP